MSKEDRISTHIDWTNPETKPHEHAERYKDQLKHVIGLQPEHGWHDPERPDLPSLTPKEATKLRNFAYESRFRNLETILKPNGITIIRKKL